MNSTQAECQTHSCEPSSPSTQDTKPDSENPSKRPSEKPSMTQPCETSQAKLVAVDVAMSIEVLIPAPDGYEDMTDEQIQEAAIEALPKNDRYLDAYNLLHCALMMHRESYKDAVARFNPAVGYADTEEI